MENMIFGEYTRKERLFQLLLGIPSGKVVTYGHLAKILGTSPRAVASMLSSNREPDRYPCFRVIASDGRVSGYAFGADEKIRRLRADGITTDGVRVAPGFLYEFGASSDCLSGVSE